MTGHRVVLDSGPLILLSDKRRSQQATEFLRSAPDWRRAVWWLARVKSIATTPDIGRAAGLLLRVLRDGSVSIVDAHVVQPALAFNAPMLRTDPRDIRRLIAPSGADIAAFGLPWPN